MDIITLTSYILVFYAIYKIAEFLGYKEKQRKIYKISKPRDEYKEDNRTL